MKILIVDDEAINRTLLTNMLYNAGYKECIEAVDGVEAIKKFTYAKPPSQRHDRRNILIRTHDYQSSRVSVYASCVKDIWTYFVV